MAYGWGTNEPQIKPIEEGGDNISQYALKIKDALDALYIELRQDIIRATLAESIAGSDIKKIITPSTAFRTYYGESEPSTLQGKNGDTYIRYGDIKETYIKLSGAWQKVDAVPQPATAEEVDEGLVNTKYITPDALFNSRFAQLNENGLLPWQFLPSRVMVWKTPGEYEWTCPENVSAVLVSGCAGGGGGGGRNTSYADSKGGCGGVGGTVINYPVAVTGGTTYAITIGIGGSGSSIHSSGSGTGGTGSAGTATKFGELLTLGGGKGGIGGSRYSYTSAPSGNEGNTHTVFAGTTGATGAAGDGPAATAIAIFGKAGYPATGNGAGGEGASNTNTTGGSGAPGLLMVIF